MKSQSLVVKDVNFEGSLLKAAMDEQSNTVFVAVRWICEGIGLSNGQMQHERKRLKDDLILNKGERNLVLHTSGGDQEILCIDIEFLPLWIAKISITPKMKTNNPEVVERLIDYQLKAKDVLARAFIHNRYNTKTDMVVLSKAVLIADKKIKEQECTIKELVPKADEYDAFINSQGNLSLLETAHSLGIGRTKMDNILRQKDILCNQGHSPLPHPRYEKSKYFVVKSGIGYNGHCFCQTYVTPKGISWIHKILQKQEEQV